MNIATQQKLSSLKFGKPTRDELDANDPKTTEWQIEMLADAVIGLAGRVADLESHGLAISARSELPEKPLPQQRKRHV